MPISSLSCRVVQIGIPASLLLRSATSFVSVNIFFPSTAFSSFCLDYPRASSFCSIIPFSLITSAFGVTIGTASSPHPFRSCFFLNLLLYLLLVYGLLSFFCNFFLFGAFLPFSSPRLLSSFFWGF